jgi:hypothetical protein
MPAYDLLAVDLDGTLFDSRGRVPPANAEALRRARAAGITVVLCTGRNWSESRAAIEAIGADAPMVCAGGSLVADPATGRTLHRCAIPDTVVRGVVSLLNREGHAALVLKDPSVSPHDYLVVSPDGTRLDPVSSWWFESHGVRYSLVETLEDDAHPEWTVRVGACAPSSRTIPMRDELSARFGGGLLFHSFPAVVAPHHVTDAGEQGTYHVVEVFDGAANKWSGIEWVCRALGIDPARTAAIGDQINDLPMIRGAGLGVAMGNAVPEIRSAARRHTTGNDECGVAHAVARILDGAW